MTPFFPLSIFLSLVNEYFTKVFIYTMTYIEIINYQYPEKSTYDIRPGFNMFSRIDRDRRGSTYKIDTKNIHGSTFYQKNGLKKLQNQLR